MGMQKNTISGAMSALVTPFKSDGSVDFATYESLIQRQIKYGMDALVPVGTTGESATLSHKEHKECIEIAIATAKKHSSQDKKIKVLAGAGSNSTLEAIELAIFAQACGADGILCVTPYYNKPTQQGLFEHYSAVAKSVEIPLMLYNVPGRTGVAIESNTIIRLFSEIPNIFGVKEAAGSMDKIVELNAKCEDLAIFSGEDAINYPILANGGVGVISVTGNIMPNIIAEITHLSLKGEYKQALKLSQKIYPLNKILFCESNPIPIKAAMYLSGILPNLTYRLPLTSPSKENLDRISKVLEAYEILK